MLISFQFFAPSEFIEALKFYFLAGLENLEVLNLGFNDITDACLAHLKGDLKY